MLIFETHIKSPVILIGYMCFFSISERIYIDFGEENIDIEKFLAIVGSVASVVNGYFRFV